MLGMVKSVPPPISTLADSAGNPALNARLRELSDHFANPLQARLTEEQRALMLGIARRLVFDIAAQLDGPVDSDALWARWMADGIPMAAELAPLCFIRAEEYRWRRSAMHRISDDLPERPVSVDPSARDEATPGGGVMTPVEQAFLALRIADLRRTDSLEFPCLPAGDIPTQIYQALALDIAAFALAAHGNDADLARKLGGRIKAMVAEQRQSAGIDAAALAYFQALRRAKSERATAADLFDRQQWWVVIAVAAGLHNMSFDAAALAILAGSEAQIRTMFEPLQLPDSAFAQLFAALDTVPNRPVVAAMTTLGRDDLDEILATKAAALAVQPSEERQ